MPTKKLATAAALAAGLTGGAAFGALLGTPLVSSAQTAEAEPDASTEERTGPLEVAAEALGMTAEELRGALDGDTSIADVAAERGVDVQVVIDALVANSTERITELVNRDGGFPVHRDDRGGPGFGAGLDAAAEAIGISEDDLDTALRDGQTIAEVAEANGVDVQVVIDALVTEATARLDEAAQEGRIDAAEADERTADLTERITDLVNGEGLPGRPFGGPRSGGPGG